MSSSLPTLSSPAVMPVQVPSTRLVATHLATGLSTMVPFAYARLFAFSAITFFSIIVLGLGAGLAGKHGLVGSYSDEFGNVYGGVRVLSQSVAGLAVAISVMTLIIVVPLLALSRLEKNSDWKKFVSRVWVELFWANVLCILWIATAVKIQTYSVAGLIINCGGPCAEVSALAGLVWTILVLLLAYVTTLGACSGISVRRGIDTFSHMQIDEVLSLKDHANAGPPVVEEGKVPTSEQEEKEDITKSPV